MTIGSVSEEIMHGWRFPAYTVVDAIRERVPMDDAVSSAVAEIVTTAVDKAYEIGYEDSSSDCDRLEEPLFDFSFFNYDDIMDIFAAASSLHEELHGPRWPLRSCPDPRCRMIGQKTLLEKIDRCDIRMSGAI